MKIAVIGVGYIGAVLSAVLAERGNKVIAIDINKNYIDKYKKGISPIKEPGLDELIYKVVNNGNFKASTDFSEINDCEVILITVGTPLKEDGSADKSAISNVIKSISPHIKNGQLIIVKSTVPPFTTEQEVGSPLCKIADVDVAFCPERLAEGNAINECKSIPVIVGGINEKSGNNAVKFWENCLGVECIKLNNARSAELVKLADNAWIDLNISLAFELAKLADKMGIDVLPVIKAANSLPKGEGKVNILLPSIGVGGYCLTKDPWFLNAFAAKYDSDFKTAITSRNINNESPIYAAKRLEETIVSKLSPKNPRNIKIGILGLAFKNNTGDCRFTPTIEFIKFLSQKGYQIEIHDPYINENDYKLFNFKNVIKVDSIDKVIRNSNVLAFLAGHKEFHAIKTNHLINNLNKDSIIFDGRMFFSEDKIKEFKSYGFTFRGIGR